MDLLMTQGLSARQVESTGMNAESSRAGASIPTTGNQAVIETRASEVNSKRVKQSFILKQTPHFNANV